MFDAYTVSMALFQLGRIINFLILARIIMSWVNPNPSSPIASLLYSVTEPILGPIRSLIYNVFKYQGMLDFSPIVAILLINWLIIPFLRNLAFMVL